MSSPVLTDRTRARIAEAYLLVTHETSALVRERIFPPSQLDNILALVRADHLTCTITVDVSQGAVCGVRVRDETRLPQESP
jgi:hypothetical protein